MPGFSGLRLETVLQLFNLKVQIMVSVPLPGFSGLRPGRQGGLLAGKADVSVPLPGFSGSRLWIRNDRS